MGEPETERGGTKIKFKKIELLMHFFLVWYLDETSGMMRWSGQMDEIPAELMDFTCPDDIDTVINNKPL